MQQHSDPRPLYHPLAPPLSCAPSRVRGRLPSCTRQHTTSTIMAKGTSHPNCLPSGAWPGRCLLDKPPPPFFDSYKCRPPTAVGYQTTAVGWGVWTRAGGGGGGRPSSMRTEVLQFWAPKVFFSKMVHETPKTVVPTALEGKCFQTTWKGGRGEGGGLRVWTPGGGGGGWLLKNKSFYGDVWVTEARAHWNDFFKGAAPRAPPPGVHTRNPPSPLPPFQVA